jgi:hypothetical protein
MAKTNIKKLVDKDCLFELLQRFVEQQYVVVNGNPVSVLYVVPLVQPAEH